MNEIANIRRRIRALRAKTVANGCTEAEAMAAAGKLAELLGRDGRSTDSGLLL